MKSISELKDGYNMVGLSQVMMQWGFLDCLMQLVSNACFNKQVNCQDLFVTLNYMHAGKCGSSSRN